MKQSVAARSIGIVFAAILAAIMILVILVSLHTYFGPGARFIPVQRDIYWLGLIGIGILAAGGLAWLGRGRILLALSLVGSLAILSIPLIFAPESRTAILVVVWMLTTACGLGELLFSSLHLNGFFRGVEKPFLWITVGLFALTALTTLLGFAGLLYSAAAYAVMVLLSLAVLWRLISRRRQIVAGISNGVRSLWKEADLRLSSWVIAILLIAWAGVFIWAVAPPVRWDSLSYHLPVPLAYIRSHAIVEMPESTQTYLAHYAEMLYTLGLLLAKNISIPGLLHFSSGLLSVGLVYLIGARLVNARVGLVSTVLFGALPIVTLESGSAYIDLFTCLYLAAGLLFVLIWRISDSPKLLALAGALLGFTVGIKINTLVFSFIIGVFVLIESYRRSHISAAFWRNLLSFLAPLVIFAVPWMIRDMVWTGNPIFPTYNNLFNSPKWFVNNLFPTREISTANALNLLRLPWDLVVNTARYYHEAPGGMLGGLTLFSLPWMYSWSPLLSQSQRQAALWGFGAALFLLVIGFLANFNGRYWLPMDILLAFLSGLNFWLAWESLRQTRFAKLVPLLGLILASGYVFGSQVSMLTAHWNLPERYPYRFFLGRESQTAFINRLFPPALALGFIENTGEVHKVLSLGVEQRLFTRSAIYAPMFSRVAYETLHDATSESDFARNLEANGFDYLLIYGPEQGYRSELYKSSVLTKAFFDQYTHLEFATQGSLVYRLIYDPAQIQAGTHPNLLTNPGFEDPASQGGIPGWEVLGATPPLAAGPVYAGQAAVELEGPSVSALQQVIQVSAGKVYTLGVWAEPESVGQTLQPIIEWLSADGQIIQRNFDWLEMQPGWQWYRISENAPDQSVSARIILSSASEGEFLLDDVCFVQGGACP